MTNNLAYCLSEYLRNDYNISLSEHEAFVLGSSLGLQALPIGEFISRNRTVSDLSRLYLMPGNAMSLSCFASNMGYIMSFHHHNNSEEMHWLVQDKLSKGKKIMIRVSGRVLHEYDDNYPVYALLSIHKDNIPSSLEDFSLTDTNVDLSFTAGKTLSISLEELKSYYVVEGNEMFNSNRYEFSPPALKNNISLTGSVFRRALQQQVSFLQLKENTSGVSLLFHLKQMAEYNTSFENLQQHKQFLLNSFAVESVLHSPDMNRKYFAACLRSISSHISGSVDGCSIAFEAAGEAWTEVFSFLSEGNNISHADIVNIYGTLISREQKAVNELISLLI